MMPDENSTPIRPEPYVFDEISRLSDAFPKTKFPSDSVSAYAFALSRVPRDMLSLAISHVIQNCKYFPAIAEIVAASKNPFRPESLDSETRKRTRLAASMCMGMEEGEIAHYFKQTRLNTDDIDMPYFRHLLATGECEREQYLAQQWLDRVAR